MFTLTPTRAFMATTCLAILPTFVAAQNVLTPIDPPAERPYPYAILGIQPGDSLDDVMAVFASRSDEEPTGESDMLTVQSPDGRSFEFTFERYREIGGQTMNERVARIFKPERVRAVLTSDVMEQRPMTLTRSLNQPSADLPTAQALQAQMEETYGPPSLVETRSGGVTLTYAWGTEGFIPDLDGQTPREITFLRSGFETTDSYVPCRRSGGDAFDTTTDYNFAYPRVRELFPDCVAIFTISYGTRSGNTGITFRLDDFDLARQHRDALDSQIIEALTGEQTVEPSNLDL
ncbi:hypothetical protein [Roseinatronobacter monicus]|uniref:Uncharacterized protein n=1 Tax=Roseinatronobacter monicus TaxID=393481 RepID=A0A543KEW2_9RHOB|nr:hypothetical protein [Roseinatronobacter monicus]TQM93619.1 hypothetical protein BD293_2261 [Roseinatronobacter monicus]